MRVAVVWAATARETPRKKLIEFGWDEPSAARAFRALVTEPALLAHLDQKTPEAYSKQYHHWHNDVLIDLHPNAEAHAMITEAIVRGMTSR